MKEQGDIALHFTQILVCDAEGNVGSLSAFLANSTHQSPEANHQLFFSYVFNYDGWKTLRIFPHQREDGTMGWYAASDSLPSSVDAEHRQFIHEALPRLGNLIEAKDWQAADAFIDRLLLYQTTFGTVQKEQPHHQAFLNGSLLGVGLFFLLGFVIYLFRRLYLQSSRHHRCQSVHSRSGRPQTQ
jgi:hypothetical protein